MTRRNALAASALTLALVALPVVAQVQPVPATADEVRLAASRTAWADLPAIRVLDNLGVSSEQAAQLRPVLHTLQTQLRAIETRLTGMAQAAALDIFATKKALLAGKPAPTAADLWRYEVMLEHARGERDDAVLSAVAKVNQLLTKQQLAMLQAADAAAPAVRPQPRPELLLRAEEAQAAWQARVQQTMMRLLQQSRGETNPQRYAQLAPQASLQAAVAVTGLPPVDATVLDLAKQLLSALDQVRRLNPAEVARSSSQLAAAMVRAVADTLALHQTNGQGDAARPPVTVTSADLEAMVRYERSPLILQSWIRERPAVLAAPGN